MLAGFPAYPMSEIALEDSPPTFPSHWRCRRRRHRCCRCTPYPQAKRPRDAGGPCCRRKIGGCVGDRGPPIHVVERARQRRRAQQSGAPSPTMLPQTLRAGAFQTVLPPGNMHGFFTKVSEFRAHRSRARDEGARVSSSRVEAYSNVFSFDVYKASRHH
jgi:hypothetical protein